jgi:beta-mannosidase
MKYTSVLISFFISIQTLLATEIQIPLNSGWQFKQSDKSEWLMAHVPGTVHTDLLDNGLIEDPYYRTNEKDLQWIEKADWEYKTSFNVNSEIITKDHIIIDFQGLDTYADVFLNDTLILKANNMFRSWSVDVSHIVKIGENKLRIYFHSPVKVTEPIYDSLEYTIPVSSNDRSEKKLSVFTRKAPYHFGWDWGPRFVTSGIWRPIILRAWDRAIMENMDIEQNTIGDDRADLRLNVDFDVTKPFIGEIDILIDGISAKSSIVDLRHGRQSSNFTFSIQNPERWWPNGLGKQKLYNIEVQLKKDGEIVHQYNSRIGLRTIELARENDKQGTSFYFKVNGQPVFIKGANYIPQDNFLTRVTPDRYEKLLQSAVNANMNMIRVWGGGIYENDIFYNLCDEKGLLVWQDFMFSCAMYPGSETFLENVRKEAEQNVIRLRNHPSLALWCGNNEVLMKWQNWRNNANEEGNQMPLWNNVQDSLKIVSAYDAIFKTILPEAVQAYGHKVPYWESSPSSQNGKYADWKSGDAHYWGVWWGQEPFDAYRANIGRFMSEYGFQSFPELSTVKTFTSEEDWDIYSDVMESHQKSSTGNKTIANYMLQHFKEPKDFENHLYLSQLLQAEGVKIAMEAHRKNKPLNMGSLIWQLNDCWPGASWSSIDYYGKWKALHYYIRSAFNEVIVTFEDDEDEVRAYMISDRTEDIKATLYLTIMDMNGKKINSYEKKVKLKANGSDLVWKSNKKDLLKKAKKEDAILRSRLVFNDEVLHENQYLFVRHKNLKINDPAIDFEFKEEGGKLLVALKSNKAAFGVTFKHSGLDLQFSDNYFTLFPKEQKIIEIISKESISEIKNKLTVKSLYDSYASK